MLKCFNIVGCSNLTIDTSKIVDKMFINTIHVKNTGVADDVITCDKTEYSSHALVEVVYGKNRKK